jgi:hypothetical protein
MASLIELQPAREAVLRADKAMVERDYTAVTEEVATAFAYEFHARRIGRHSSFHLSYSIRHSLDLSEVGQALENLADTVKSIEQEVLLLRYGIDAGRHRTFKSLTPDVAVMMDGTTVGSVGRGLKPTEAQARFCYDFVIDTILQLQERDTPVVPIETFSGG